MKDHLKIAMSVLIAAGLSAAASARNTLVYNSDFSSDPGWTTSVPGQMYWDSASGRYHIENRAGGGQYSFIGVSLAAGTSFRLAFDLTMVRLAGAGAISLGVSDGVDPYGSNDGIWTNWGHGSGGNGATAGYQGSNGFGSFPGAYDFRAVLDTTYHVTMTLNAGAQVLEWEVSDGASTLALCAVGNVGNFGAFDRIMAQNVNNGGGTAEGYIDNLSLWTGEFATQQPGYSFFAPPHGPVVPLPGPGAMAGVGCLALLGVKGSRRQRTH